ncbi:MAG: TRAP transporter large permease [Cellvibrionaceae bacterium]
MLLVSIVLLITLLLLSIPVAAALGILGLSLDALYSDFPLYLAAGDLVWHSSNDFILVAIPLFILLGEVMLRGGIAEKMYTAMSNWIGWLPGGLMHSNIGASALFAATSGSSVATAATIGTVAEPQIALRNYNRPLFLGTLAVGGTLGILIPPSINMIIYGVLTDTSIPKLYLAGIVPGLILAGLFSLTVIIACLWKSEWDGVKNTSTWSVKLHSLKNLLPPILIFSIVIFSIYLGWATATESAALGVLCALLLTLVNGSLSWNMLMEALEGTMKTTAMVMLIILAAHFLNFILSGIGLTAQLANFVANLGLSPLETLLAIVAFYIILGFFMETLTLMVTTIPIVAPIIFQAGFDPVWFGILLMLLIETALITPPIGLNLYVIQGIRSDGGSLNDVIKGSIPFVAVLFLMIILVIVFPGIVI